MKTLNKMLIFATMVAVLASCGKEEKKDYTLNDITPLIATYSGSCIISCSDFSEKKETTQQTIVRFVKTNEAKALALETNEFGLILQPVIKNFKTSEDGNSYIFSLDGFEQSWGGVTAPSYINEWLLGGSNFSSIKSVKATMQPTSGKYDIATKIVTFTYEAKTIVVGTYASDNESSQTKTITYQYRVTKN